MEGELTLYGIIKRILTAPLALLCPALCIAGDDIDFEALGRMVDSRVARAERGVLRDYFAQRGLEREDAALAEERYRELRKASHPDAEQLNAARRRCGEAERRLRELGADSAARVRMARLGVDDDIADDVLVLARRQLERDGITLSDDEREAAESMKKAVDAVLGRLPQLARAHTGGADGIGSGSTGNFPRNGGGQDILQRQLDSLRAAGDTASAVALINAAAEKGITLR